LAFSQILRDVLWPTAVRTHALDDWLSVGVVGGSVGLTLVGVGLLLRRLFAPKPPESDRLRRPARGAWKDAIVLIVMFPLLIISILGAQLPAWCAWLLLIAALPVLTLELSTALIGIRHRAQRNRQLPSEVIIYGLTLSRVLLAETPQERHLTGEQLEEAQAALKEAARCIQGDYTRRFGDGDGASTRVAAKFRWIAAQLPWLVAEADTQSPSDGPLTPTRA